jgi:putative hydrolase of the HAD superfamily
VIFDLDDTLIDTKGLLLPDALRRTAAALGVPVERLDPGGKRFEEVARALLPLEPGTRDRAAREWYSPDVPPLEPLPGTRELLRFLAGWCVRMLVTRGDPARQRRKIERCALEGSFEAIVIRPIDAPGSKRDDFERLLARFALAPARCAVVGDDERDELAHGAALGCRIVKVPDVPLAAIPARLRSWGWDAAPGGSPSGPGST